MKMIRLLLLLILFSTKIYSQSLTFSSSGQTGLSGTNWSVSGSNPVKISSTGASSINTSVVQGYINSGVDVIISSVDQVIINNDINKTNSGRLIIKSGTNSISGTGKIILGNNAQLLINQGATISNNIELNSGTSTIGFAPIEVEYLIVAGGGSGGVGRGGGGGAGGVLSGSTEVSSGSYSILVGSGGNAVTNDNRGINGSNSSAFNFLAIGGGGGGGWVSGSETGLNGGSGGGASASPFSAGTGIAGQGNNGFSLNFYREPGGGGGGAGLAATSQNGGNGIISNITGNGTWYGGGGGAGAWSSGASLAGLGGNGGGGNGTKLVNGAAFSGQANTGGGGGGSEGFNGVSGAGGSGIVVLRYLGADVTTADIEYSGSNWASGYQVNEFRQLGTRTFSIIATLFQGVVSGQITGSGNLILNPGSGVINITGVNSYSGSTTIESGRVQIGNNGTQGNLGSGNIENKGQLQFNRSNSITISNIISGTGTIIQQGTGSLIFTQNNTYSGSTTISSGSIQIGNNSSTGTFGTGNVINNSAMIVSRSNDLTLNNLISGTGTLTKELSNTLILTQNNTYVGNTSINGGILILRNNDPNPTSKTYNGNGALQIEPSATSFTSGFTTSGLTFSSTLTGLTLGKNNNDADVTVASTATIAGPIAIYGRVITVNSNLTTSTSSPISLFARSGLRFNSSGITLQTGGGAVVLSGDHDANNSGNIIAEGALTITTNGGAISMGGGATGTDFAYGIGTSSIIANDQTAGIWVRGSVNLNSGNGNISIRGYAANASPIALNIPTWGVGLGVGAAVNTNPASVSINSGTGIILIEGFARNPAGSNSNSYGVVFNNWEAMTTQPLTITSANTTANAIRLIGNTENTLNGQRAKNSLRFWSTNSNILATGNGGGISLSGKTFDGNDHTQISWSGGNILATSGPIVINTENESLQIENDMYIGSRSGLAGNTISSSNVRFSIDDLSVASGRLIRIATTGSLTIEPFGSSFTDYTPPTNTIVGFTTATGWSLNENAQTLTSLIIGKPLNTSNITIGSTTTIAGPVTVYGGNININENLNTTSGGTNGDILLKATSDITFAKAKTTSSMGGDMIFWSDADGNGSGDIFFASENNYTNPVTISTGGGNLWLGGGSGTTSWNGLTVGNAHAVGNGARTVGGSFTHFNGITLQGTSISTSGGHIELKGSGKTGDFSSTYSGGIYIAGTGSMNSGGGNINIEALAQSGAGQKYGFYNLGPNYTFSLGSGDFNLFGDASASSGGTTNTTGNGVLLWSGAISSIGNINISGKKSTTNGTFGVYSNVNISTTGANKNIIIEANNLNISGGSIASSGQLILKPFDASTSIGIAGAAGTLALPASYFSTNFTDGFSNIQIGSNIQTGNIAANAFTLRDNMTFLTSGGLTLGGKPILGSNNVTLGNAISSISGTPTHYFQTNGSGKMITTLANNASRIFSLGNTYYNPVTITNNTGNSDTFSVRVIDSVSGNGDTGRQITTPHVKATWDISKNNANSGSGIDMQFSWQSSQEIGGITNFVLNHHNGTIWEIAAGITGSVSGTTTKTITHTGYTGSFSPFAFGNSVTPLPVELKSFNTICHNDYVQVNWTTASEIRNQTFELYKSDNAINWNIIHTTDGQGDKATETDYSFKDIDKKSNYYRLKDIDFDGIENWSPIIFADCKNESNQIEVYPNPASEFIKVIIPFEEHTILNILSMEGKTIKSIPLVSKNNLINIKDLSNGVYLIEISNKTLKKYIKFVKN
jgi:fibronectin-binding autotransporter adhesin